MEKVTTLTTNTGKNANRFLTKLRQSISDGVQLLSYSVLFSHLTFIPYVHAGPTGGAVVGGVGDINQAGLNTTINQTSQNMAIDWQTFKLTGSMRRPSGWSVQFPHKLTAALCPIIPHSSRTP